MAATQIKLGLKENLGQFSLLVLVNAFVGAMVGLERAIIPQIAERDFNLEAKTAILSFIVAFGISKAIANYFAGILSDGHLGRKKILVFSWLIAAPVPLLLMWADSWNLIIFANILLGISQGFTWSMAVVMKIDLVGPTRRGFAMGLNEFAGYFAVAGSALATGYIAANYGLRPEPFILGIGYVVLGFLLSTFMIRETKGHASLEIRPNYQSKPLTPREIFVKTTFKDRNLSSVSQAGLVNNLNDGMAWGLFPILFAAAGLSTERIGWLAAIYPATWGVLQLVTGHLSDKWGRKWLIAAGMWVQALGIGLIAYGDDFFVFATGSILLGVGTAMVYPTLLATIGDIADPSWRASSVGVYRLWRDLGYAVGAIVAGVTADFLGLHAAVWLVAGITLFSGIVVAIRQRETKQPRRP